MGNESYDNISNNLKEAANELRGDKDSTDTEVSVDSTWQKKGFVSSLGVVTALSVDSGMVLDVSFMSKASKACTSRCSNLIQIVTNNRKCRIYAN